MKNPFDVLGIDPDASTDDVKRRYRALALQHHPDKNPGDAAAAQARFQAIQQAYEQILADRAGGGDESPPMNQDPLSDLFSAFGFDFDFRIKMPPITLTVLATLEDAVRRRSLPVTFTRDRQGCPQTVQATVALDPATLDAPVVLRGQGHWPRLQHAQAGDVIIHIRVATHALFTRDGMDLHMTKTVALRDALVGLAFGVPTLDGRVLQVESRDVIKPGDVRVVRGEGLAPDGDLYIHFLVEFPSRLTLTQRQQLGSALL